MRGHRRSPHQHQHHDDSFSVAERHASPSQPGSCDAEVSPPAGPARVPPPAPGCPAAHWRLVRTRDEHDHAELALWLAHQEHILLVLLVLLGQEVASRSPPGRQLESVPPTLVAPRRLAGRGKPRTLDTVLEVAPTELETEEAKLFDVNEGIKRALTELLNCDAVRADHTFRTWVQCRLMDTERELRSGRRRRSNPDTELDG